MKIHQVKGRLVNSYVIEDSGKLCVADVAVNGEKYVLGYIDQVLKRPVEDVELVMCTHDDPDHIGGVLRLAKQCNAESCYPLAAFDQIKKIGNDPSGMLFRIGSSAREVLRSRAWDMYFSPERNRLAKDKPARELDDEVVSELLKSEPDHRLKGGDGLPGFPDWQVLHTPGHTWDSCCYYHHPTKSLISGDTLLGSKKKGFVVTPSIYSNPIHLFSTISKLKGLDPRSIYPGHGSYFQGENLLGHL